MSLPHKPVPIFAPIKLAKPVSRVEISASTYLKSIDKTNRGIHHDDSFLGYFTTPAPKKNQ